MLGSSLVKSISIREGKDGKRALHLKQKEKKYRSVVNYHFSVITFIEFPLRLRKYNGYLLGIHRIDGISMWVFVTLIYSVALFEVQ